MKTPLWNIHKGAIIKITKSLYTKNTVIFQKISKSNCD